MSQSTQDESLGRKGALPRLKHMSTATVRRLSRPLSLVSGRSTSPAPERTPNKLKKTSTRNSIASHTSHARKPSSSRRTSLLSTRDSSTVSRGDREPLGELPVFGVSQRAYLASLVSLFSESNERSTFGSPHSANTPITDPSSATPSLGSYQFDIHSPAIYRYSKERRLYVGWPGLIHPPPEALLEFEMETLPLMEQDLQNISAYLGQRGIRITYELRMSGYASATAETVCLSPTVWILYRPSWTMDATIPVAQLHQAVSDIFYLQKGLEIQEGGGRIELTSDRGLIDLDIDEKESTQLSGGGKLSVHIENCQGKHSVCGALCCVTITDEAKQVQSLCRIGGLLKVNGKYILGITSAHAMLEGSGIFRDSFNEMAESRLPLGNAVDRDEILSESRRVSAWHSVSRDAAVGFLGISMNSRGEMAINRSKPENATDFALLRLSTMPGYVRNKYIPPLGQEAITIKSTASASAASMDEGPVHIICGDGDVAEGQLVWGSACFIIRGSNFRARRIQTSRPLSAGTTGAWVVRGEVLYGVILAVYPNEPFALMMTVERLFASILGSAFSIRSVEIWDGKMPEALLQKVQQERKGPRKTKNGTPDNSRRRANTETRDSVNGASSSKNIEIINGSGTSSRHRSKSAGTTTSTHNTLPRTAEDGTQTEESCPPITNAVVDVGTSLSKSTEIASSSGSSSRRKVQKRSESMASDVSMSGAVQDDLLPSVSNGRRKSRTNGSVITTGTRTTYTSASETSERQDSGFEQAVPPVQTPIRPVSETKDVVPRQGLQAPPIRPADKRRVVDLRRNRDGASPDATPFVNTDSNWNEDCDDLPTQAPPPDKRSSSHNVFKKTFGRSSRKGPSQNDNDSNEGNPAISLSGRSPLFSRHRRSSAIEPKETAPSRDGNSSNAPSTSNETPSSSIRTGTATSQTREWFVKDNKSSNPPNGLTDRRPLSFIRRTSSKAPESTHSQRDSNPDNTGGSASANRSGSQGERPLSFLRRSKGKSNEDPTKKSVQKNNFGIPHKGL